ncbi:MAG TPA: transglutaminase family protein [Rugosimonospora sp.]|nr:transglutaminase family protein [Rugosimonospora sp.]
MSVPTLLAVQVAVARRAGADISDRMAVVNNAVSATAQEIPGPDGGRQHLITAQPGALTIDYEASVEDTASSGPQPATRVHFVEAVRPSRYCPSDRMAGFARSHFGDVCAAADRVRAICDYVWRHVQYEADSSDSSTDAVGTLLAARGVCRDFAHLIAALCRAVGIPARIAAVYAPGLCPMDFHVVVETVIDGYWYVWDATRLAPRPAMVRIATGRDAADVAFSTVVSGGVELSGLEITATTSGDLPRDDHQGLVVLA